MWGYPFTARRTWCQTCLAYQGTELSGGHSLRSKSLGGTKGALKKPVSGQFCSRLPRQAQPLTLLIKRCLATLQRVHQTKFFSDDSHRPVPQPAYLNRHNIRKHFEQGVQTIYAVKQGYQKRTPLLLEYQEFQKDQSRVEWLVLS